MLARLHFRFTTTMQYARAAEGGRFMCQVCGLSYDHVDSMALYVFQLHYFGRINSSFSSKAGCSWTLTLGDVLFAQIIADAPSTCAPAARAHATAARPGSDAHKAEACWSY